MYKFSVNWMLVVTFLVVIISCEKEEDFNPKFPAKKFVATGTYQGEYWPTNEWRSCSPEEVGMDPKKLKEMNEDIVILLKLHIDVRSVVIIRNGYIVAEQYYSEDYGADSLHRIYSCTKSITSAAMGIAIDEGFIADEYQPLLSFFPEYSVRNPGKKERSL